MKVTGWLEGPSLVEYLNRATVGVVSQQYDGAEFNVPSKLMHFMARGIPVIAAVRPDSEVADIVNRSGGGWVADSTTDEFGSLASRVLSNPRESVALRGPMPDDSGGRNYSSRSVSSLANRPGARGHGSGVVMDGRSWDATACTGSLRRRRPRLLRAIVWQEPPLEKSMRRRSAASEPDYSGSNSVALP